MNLYVRIINDVLDHIEQNISDPLTLQGISEQFHLSAFHFSCLFKTFTGMSLKQYILGRKLTIASVKLKTAKAPVTDIAYDLGFQYPEVFSRNFKKWFGISPSAYRNDDYEISAIPKAAIVQRDIINFSGVFALKEIYTYLSEQYLHGIVIEADENAVNFHHTLQSAGENFLTDKNYYSHIKDKFFYTVVNCYGDDTGRYSVFYGGEPSDITDDADNSHLISRRIPAGWYACFSYNGVILDMLKIFNNDFYKWLIVKEIELCSNGIGMITIYDRQDMQNLQILVPVKQPKQDSKKSHADLSEKS